MESWGGINPNWKCTHEDSDTERFVLTFDVGNGKTKQYELCRYCKQHPIFNSNLVNERKVEPISLDSTKLNQIIPNKKQLIKEVI